MKKKKIPIFWITGNIHQRNIVWNKIIKGESPVPVENPNIIYLECGRNPENLPIEQRLATAIDIVRILKNKDMFDSRTRILKLKGIPTGYKLLMDYFYLINKKNILVIDSPVGFPSAPPAKQFVSIKHSNFFKEIKTKGYFLEFPEIASSVQEARKWVHNVFDDYGKKIQEEAVCLLVDYLGLNLDILHGYILTLIDLDTKKVTVDDIKEICPFLFLDNIWDLIEFISLRDADRSLSYLQRFYQVAGLDTGMTFFGDVQKLLSSLRLYFLFLFLVRHHSDEMTYKNFCAAVSGMKKKYKNGKSNEMFGTRFIKTQLKSEPFARLFAWKIERVNQAFKVVNDSIFMVRKRNKVDDLKMCLDSLILFLCGKIKENSMELLQGKVYN